VLPSGNSALYEIGCFTVSSSPCESLNLVLKSIKQPDWRPIDADRDYFQPTPTEMSKILAAVSTAELYYWQ
jgi:hypothetical protein